MHRHPSFRQRLTCHRLVATVACLFVAACAQRGESGNETDADTDADVPTATDLVWAMNVGGPAYEGVDGTPYEAENSIKGGTAGKLDVVKGSQDSPLYHGYRAGDISVTKAMDNGVYDVTLHFAEPDEVEGGTRVFDVLIESVRAIEDLDIMAWRDGKVKSALTVTVPNVEVAGGALSIEFEAESGEPVLSAVVVRNKERPGPWRLTWSDEFEGEGLPDETKWSIDEWPARKVNDEDQAYTARSKNLRLENGHLVIEAHREDYDDAKYTSGRIHSSGKGDFLYGRAEVRALLPRGMGTWAAAWMLPSDPFKYATTCEEGEDWQGSDTCDAWPKSGEIDILEHVGYQMGHLHGTVHNVAYYWLNWEQRKGRILVDGVDEDFHVYAMEWSPERIDMFVDDTHYFTYMNEGEGWQAWPYDHAFHMILNLAVGGQWGRAGGGIDESIFPQRMLVDYVRIYEAE